MFPLIAAALAGAMTLFSSPALAHSGHDHGADTAWSRWTLDPWVTLLLLALALVFVAGWLRLRARTGRGRARLDRQALFFGLGWLSLAGALVSPLHAAGERSFLAHMVEHEILMLVAAPLLVLSRPGAMLLWAFPPPTRTGLAAVFGAAPVRGAWRALSGPVTASLLQAAALWLWHLPVLFDRALAGEGWHAAQHLSFTSSALLFWTAMLGRQGGRAADGVRRAAAALCLFATSLVSGALGALMAVSESPWYAAYATSGHAPFGLTPAEDQQLAGLVMWVPGGLVHATAALVLVRTLLRDELAQREAARAR